MATAVVAKALSYVGDKLLAYFTDNLLKDWAASINLGTNVQALEGELLLVKALLDQINGKEIHNLPLKQLLDKLQELGYDADDVLDEMDYFRIQDELDGTFHAGDEHAGGWVPNLALNVQHTATATAGKLNRLWASSRPCCDTIIHAVGTCFPCSPLPLPHDDDEENSGTRIQHNSSERSHTNEPPKLIFDRVGASNKMNSIVEEMLKLRKQISEIIRTPLGSQLVMVPHSAQSRPPSNPGSIEQRLYGRELMMNSIIHDIINGKYSSEVLTVIPIVGPGGIGKTTLAQHIFDSEKLQQHFYLRVWICVSLNFDVNKLIEQILQYIPKVDNNERICTPGELIGQRLIKGRKLLLVLDDIWDCKNEDQWKQLLLPFKKSQERGNIILATTRFPAQAQIMDRKNYHSIHLQGIENEEFKELFLKIVFDDDDKSRKEHTFLHEIGFRIAGYLKGSPLAAKTVGRLLKTKLTYNHWRSVLENKEWEQNNDENSIMPALKLSYDYLPCQQLKQCFSYCALFPQDYKFEEKYLITFLIGQEVVHSSCGQNKMVEDIVRNHLTQLVDYGLLERNQEKDGNTYYNIHDLLHELACKVSSHECLIIDSIQSHMRSLQVLPSIRHLSINIEDNSVNDRLTRKDCVEDLNTVLKSIKVEKLRTLMLFGKHHGCFVKAFGDLFREAKALRVIFLSKASYDVEYLLCNFYSLLHLRYLRIESSSLYKARFPNKLSRFYHMIVIDAKHCNIIDDLLPRDSNNLAKLRHLLVQKDTIHSSIADVGKIRSLKELRRFVVKQEDLGFELKEIRHLNELCGLSIYNLQNVEVEEEASEAKLSEKRHLHELILHWDNIDSSTNGSTLEGHVLERLKPNSNLVKLSIKGHRGTTCPSWLCTNLSIKSLESLCLDGVAWETFPPIGELMLVNVPCEELSSNIHKERFGNLKRLELCKLNVVKKWVVHAPCELFPFLEVLIIKDCSQLVELSFRHITCYPQDKEANGNLFPKLEELEIRNCPQLLSFPPVPWSEAPCSINIEGIGNPCLGELVCAETYNSGYVLTIEGKNGTNDSTFWNVLDFRNVTGLTELRMIRCECPSLNYLQMLSSLRSLWMSCSSNVFPFVEADRHINYQFPVECLTIDEWNASGKELTQLLTYFPKLSDLWLRNCHKQVTGLGVNVRGQCAAGTPGPSSPANKVEQQQDTRAEDDVIVAPEEAERGLLLLPPQLQELQIYYCPQLSILRSNPHDDSNGKDGRTWRGGFQGLTSLRRLVIVLCPYLLYSYSSSSFSSSFPFPNSLQCLEIWGAMATGAPVSLSNLTALTRLDIFHCAGLRGEGLLSLLVQGHLTKLSIIRTPNFFVDSEPSQVHEQEIPSCSSKLQELKISDVARFTDAPTHRRLLFSSLTTLRICEDGKVEGFTEQQEDLLLVNSLDRIFFYYCRNLQSLPERLHRLPNLKTLYIRGCKAIPMLPKDGLPSSLEVLNIRDCPEMQSLLKDCLPDSLQKLEIEHCPAIRSLPEVDDLPSSLRELYVCDCGSEELRRQCRKLINIIPIVIA